MSARSLESVLAKALVEFWVADLDPEEAEWVRQAGETREAVDAYVPSMAEAVRAWMAEQ